MMSLTDSDERAHCLQKHFVAPSVQSSETRTTLRINLPPTTTLPTALAA